MELIYVVEDNEKKYETYQILQVISFNNSITIYVKALEKCLVIIRTT